MGPTVAAAVVCVPTKEEHTPLIDFTTHSTTLYLHPVLSVA